MDKPVISGDTIRVPSDQEFLQDVDAFLEGTLRGFGVEESAIADIAISVSELVNNAMMHGNRASREKPVTVRIAFKNRTVTITVCDEGSGFTPADIKDPLADDNLLKEVGRGIFIVRSLMDKVDINATDRGTEVRISKAV